VRTLVCVPTYQEAANVDRFLRAVRSAAPQADILVCDDNSPDGTGDIAERVGAEVGQVEVLHRPAKTGLGEAYREAFGLALDRGYERLVQIDADLSHDPQVIPKLLKAIDDGADVAIGSRYVEGGQIPHWPWFRRALSKVGNRYAGIVLGLKVRDATSGYRAYRAETLREIDLAATRAKGYGFQIETAYRIGTVRGAVKEEPIIFTDRVRGYSKMTWGIFAEELLLVTWWGVRDRVTFKKARTRRRSRKRAADVPSDASVSAP
jgi:dolichol-phosphate mannosyltransferase